jgi:hypothetical protein
MARATKISMTSAPNRPAGMAWVVAALFGLAACSDGLGGGRDGGAGGTTGAGGATGGAGTSGNAGTTGSAGRGGSTGTGGSPGAAADSFVGTWTYSQGSLMPRMCMVGGVAIPAIALTGSTLVITKTDATHISANGGTGCVVPFTVSGSVATAASGSTCAVTVMGIRVTLSITSWTLTLAGGSLTSAETGSAPIGGSSCTATGTGTLTKG